MGFLGLDDPVVVTGFKATHARKLTPGQKEANLVLAAGRVPVERGFAHLKNWRILTKLRTDPARATHLFRALFVMTNNEATTDN
ncbi:transposase family protein [Streptomyces sp. NPDC004980]